jgi:hypothetical protein
MHPHLTLVVAQQHIDELRRAADHDRLVQAATTASCSDAATAGRPVAAAPVTLIRRLRRRVAQTRPAAR